MLNPGCHRCDFALVCKRKIIATYKDRKEELPAKTQRLTKTTCENIVQDHCRDCYWYQTQKCAAWRVVNGKVVNTSNLTYCPDKATVKEN